MSSLSEQIRNVFNDKYHCCPNDSLLQRLEIYLSTADRISEGITEFMNKNPNDHPCLSKVLTPSLHGIAFTNTDKKNTIKNVKKFVVVTNS